MRRSRYFLLSILLVTVSVPGAVVPTPRETILLRSWKTGKGTVVEKTHDIILSRRKIVNIPVSGGKEKKYVLSVKYLAPTERLRHYWIVEFREKLRLRSRLRFSENLLVPWKPGPGGDSFPREDFIGYLYPRKTYDYLVAGTPWTDGMPFYPIDAVRKIRIEGFSITLEVIGAEALMSSSDPNELLTLRVIFENTGTNGRL